MFEELIVHYNIILPRYKKLWNCISPYIYVKGPRASGKSVFCCQYTANYALTHPNSVILIFGRYFELKNAISIISDILDSYIIKKSHCFIKLQNGSYLYFKGWSSLLYEVKGRSIDLLMADVDSYELSLNEQKVLLDLYDYATAYNHPFITVYSEETME